MKKINPHLPKWPRSGQTFVATGVNLWMKMKMVIVLIFLLGCTIGVYAQSQYAEVYPSNWWVGMKHNEVQLLLHSQYPDFSKEDVKINYPGVEYTGKYTFENGKYMALNLTIDPKTKPGIVEIQFPSSKQKIRWELKPRREGNGTRFAQGVTSEDFIYLLMPDRFSNGDSSNDRIPGMKDQSLNQDSLYDRHGGDLQGVISHLDYLQDMGVTALWMTPVIENDMPNRTEHGYAFTNHYKVDPRLGGEKAYLALSDSLHARGMKLIQDAVYNHIGLQHFLVQDAPAQDWLHRFPHYTQTNYRDQLYFDSYAAPSEKKVLTDGWFTSQMPDLNQENPFVAAFLIQHAIWSVEMFGVDGWRIDTYIYNNLDFMNRCNQALMDEYPRITMFGETWVHGTANQAYFAENIMNTPFKSNLPGVTDFQAMMYGIHSALTEKTGWIEGVNRLYTTLSNDFLYKDPMRNVIMLDNHDYTRILSTVGEDVAKAKMAVAWLLTCRGIPQLYYGTEVLMKGVTNPDGWVRLDFPGGWKGDKKNAFTGAGLEQKESDMQAYVKKLANFRKNSLAIQTGKMMQYVPKNGLYVYFRYNESQTVMCVMNTGSDPATVSLDDYPEWKMKGFTKARNVVSDETVILGKPEKIAPWEMWVLELY